MTENTYPQIRPMTIGELLDKAINLYRKHFLVFIGIYAIPYIPLMVLQSVFQVFSTNSMLESIDTTYSAFPFTPEMMGTMLGGVVLAFMQFILVQGLATAAITRAVANNYINRSVGIIESYRTLSNSWLKLLVAMLFIGILIVILLIWTIIPCVGWLSGPGILVFLSMMVAPLIAPVVSLENLGVSDSFRRAWNLARNRFWWLLGVVFVLSLLGQLIVTGPVLLVTFLLQAGIESLPITFDQQLILSSLLQNLFTMFMTLLYLPLNLTIITLVYFDLRTRSEGLDLAIQMPAAADTEGKAFSLPPISSNINEPFITGIDVGRFILLSLIVLALYGLITSIGFGLFSLLMR